MLLGLAKKARAHCRHLSVLLLTGSMAGCVTYSKAIHQAPAKVAVTGGQRSLLNAVNRAGDDPLSQLGLYLDSADDARRRLAANTSDTLAQADYRFAVSRLIEGLMDQGLKPWDEPFSCPSAAGHQWVVNAPRTGATKDWNPNDFLLLSADRYTFKGKLAGRRTVKQGIGAPIVVSNKAGDFSKTYEFAPGKKIFFGITAVVHFSDRHCKIEFINPLEHETVIFDGEELPLAANFQAPLALGMAEVDPIKQELGGMFKPKEFSSSARLGLLQPYHPDKIPVLCIHGLGNSSATWMPLIDHLRGNASIRRHYQFLFFSYPSGFPYPMVAAKLRERLDAFDAHFPDHKDFVILGHSMGGMIARLLITDSEMELWDLVFDKPPAEIPFHERTRDVMTATLIFKARSNIDRVIFCSASHRGSEVAVKPLGKLGSRIIGDPISESVITLEALAFARKSIDNGGRGERKHLPNSIDVLNPDSQFLKKVAQLPPKPDVSFHSIIGDRGKGGHLDRTKPQSSDGVVPYWSSHIDGAETETIVPSDHWSHLHPFGMDEIERILMSHIR